MSSAADHDETQLAEYAAALADGIVAALPGWVERCVRARCVAAGVTVDADLASAAAAAGRRCGDELGPRVRALLAADIDDQTTTPLAMLRQAVTHPTEVLRAAGVPAPSRDEFAERAFPDDLYDLSPSTFADLDPDLAEPGLVWGAAKAHVHLSRRRVEGRR